MTESLRRCKKICPLLSIPGVTIDIFRDDWLHAVDQGIGADFIGNLFVLIMRKLPGTKAQQAEALWKDILAWYDIHKILDRLKSFGWNNVQAEAKKPPKFRGCNAATTRALIPFADLVAQKYLSDDVPEEEAAKVAAHHLLMCYQSMSSEAIFPEEVLLDSSIAFALQFSTLDAITQDPFWRVMPKMHRFLELCSDSCMPNLFWTYRDEDFGGSVAHQSKMRGAWKKTSSYMRHALNLFALGNDEPRIM
jgi:hypothetical protein